MSDTAYSPRPRATRARTLGDAVPLIRVITDEKTTKIVPKSADELRADREAARDAAPMTTRCAVDGCGWTHTGPAGDCRLEAAAHRVTAHPELTGVRTRRAGIRLKRRGEHVDPAVVAESRRLRQERDDAARLEQIERGRRSRGELLEEVASAPGGAHSDAASSSSPTEEDTVECKIDGCEADASDAPKAGWGAKLCKPHRSERGREIAAARAGRRPAPEPKPQRALVVAENALREPLRTADIPYDADILEAEAEFLRRRADALTQIATGVRALADTNAERAA